ncbi:MAG: toxic anion resistance protein [Oscillospiraceae bacterium]|nr:toxic anion resistance protein [Oscillospiraceae bacterium]
MDQNQEYVPSLTLTPSMEDPAAPDPIVELQAAKVEEAAGSLEQDLGQLSEAERAQVETFAKQIDISDTNVVLQYGAAAQQNIATFSGSALNNVRTKDMGEVGGMLSGLVVELRGLGSEEEKRGFLGLVRRGRNHLASLKAQYDKAEVNVNQIVNALETHQVTLLKDIAMLDKMYEMNKAYFKELSMYILAGKTRLQEAVDVELKAIREKALATKLPEDAQAANDFASKVNRFEKKIHDLELTRMISIQMAPQIRMIQHNDALMVEKIQSSIVNTIPLWKSQMVLAIGMHNAKDAMEAQRSVTDVTNELLKKNAAALKQGSVEVAREAERGIVDIETLQATNQNLIETLEEVQQIQAEGSQRRRDAEVELGRIEGDLKQKLLEMQTR